MRDVAGLTEDALRRFREAIAEDKPTVTIFRCNAEAVTEEIAVLREQLATATARAQRFQDALMRIVMRVDCCSVPIIRGAVADALEITVEELEQILEVE